MFGYFFVKNPAPILMHNIFCKEGIGLHPRKVPQRRRHRRPILGDRSLCSGILLGRGIAHGAIFIDSTAIFIDVADSYDEEGVVLPQG
jgi:hypothetical protein